MIIKQFLIIIVAVTEELLILGKYKVGPFLFCSFDLSIQNVGGLNSSFSRNFSMFSNSKISIVTSLVKYGHTEHP